MLVLDTAALRPLAHACLSTLVGPLSARASQASKIRTRVTPPLRTEWRARLHAQPALAPSRIDPAKRPGPLSFIFVCTTQHEVPAVEKGGRKAKIGGPPKAPAVNGSLGCSMPIRKPPPPPPHPAARGPRALLRCLLPPEPIRCPRPTRCPRPPARARPDAPSAVRHGPLAAAPSAAAAPGAGAG